MTHTFLDNITGVPQMWACIKDFVLKNRFDATRMDIDAHTGHLIAQEGGNLKFSMDSNGHLISEVT